MEAILEIKNETGTTIKDLEDIKIALEGAGFEIKYRFPKWEVWIKRNEKEANKL